MKIIHLIKSSLFLIALSCSTTSLMAQEERQMISGYLMEANGAQKPILLVGTNNKGLLFYKENLNAKIQKSPITKFSAIWVFEPKDVTKAKNLYEARKYKQALVEFKKLQIIYKDFKQLDDNYIEIAKYYEMECYRKLKDYKALSDKLEKYSLAKLTHPVIIKQVKLYKMYDAVHKNDWANLQVMCEEFVKDIELTLNQRAQVSYCLGLAYEGQKQYDEALDAFATAMTADYNRSDSVVRESALKSLGIFAADKEVLAAMKLWKSDDENKYSEGYRKLSEANALARLYDTLGLGFGVSLPVDYKKFQSFKSDDVTQQSKTEEK